MGNNSYTEEELNQVCEDAFVNIKEACMRLQEKTGCANEVGVSMLGSVAEFYLSHSNQLFQGTPSIMIFNPSGILVAFQAGPVPVDSIEAFIAQRSN